MPSNKALKSLTLFAGLRGYRPGQAQKLSYARWHEAHKARKITDEVRGQIEMLLRQELSPQQVANYLERHTGVSLHHETIYQLIYSDKVNGGDIYTHLRIASKPYRKRYRSNDRRGKIKNRVSIDELPAIESNAALERKNFNANVVCFKWHVSKGVGRAF